ncbi:MAG: hydroxyisourate hydrolase [Alphaproteobacteria bacterium]|nr:hydroxyisourate hydrolase [Alphaproteobacteria bacterium]
MAGLTTHALDIMHGRGAAGMRVDFSVRDGDSYRQIGSLVTNADGRTDRPFLDLSAMRVDRYQLLFHVGDYFRALGVALADPPFFDRVPVRFAIADIQEHYHVPLLVAPWGYSTYRGS